MIARQLLTKEHNRDITVAWMTANFTRAKKLPKIESLLAKSGPKKPQSVSAMKSALQSILGAPKAKTNV